MTIYFRTAVFFAFLANRRILLKFIYSEKGTKFCEIFTLLLTVCTVVKSKLCVWQYGLWSFQTGGTKLEIFLPKNQHTQRKLLNFESWINGEPQQLAKIRVFKVDYFSLSLFLVPKLKLVTKNEWKKHPYIFFLLLVQK